MKSTLCALFCFVSLSAMSAEDYSYSKARLMDFLQQDPHSFAYVNATLDLDPAENALINGNQLGNDIDVDGPGICYYSLRAKPKGITGDWQFYFEVIVKTTFFDESGSEVSPAKGVPISSVKERLLAFRIIPISDVDEK